MDSEYHRLYLLYKNDSDKFVVIKKNADFDLSKCIVDNKREFKNFISDLGFNLNLWIEPYNDTFQIRDSESELLITLSIDSNKLIIDPIVIQFRSNSDNIEHKLSFINIYRKLCSNSSIREKLRTKFIEWSKQLSILRKKLQIIRQVEDDILSNFKTAGELN